jgi:hypothetical protein
LKFSHRAWFEAALVVVLITVSLLLGVELTNKPATPGVVIQQTITSATDNSGRTFEGSLNFTVPSHGENFTQIGIELAINVSCFGAIYCEVSFASLANLVEPYQTHLNVSLPSNTSEIRFDSVPGPAELTVITGYAARLGGPATHPGEDEFHATVTVLDYGA